MSKQFKLTVENRAQTGRSASRRTLVSIVCNAVFGTRTGTGAALRVTLPVTNKPGRVVLNEVLAKNINGLTNLDGSTPEWIELYNPTTNACTADGYFVYPGGSVSFDKAGNEIAETRITSMSGFTRRAYPIAASTSKWSPQQASSTPS